MSPSVESLYQAALALPHADRLALAQALLAASEHPDGPALGGAEYLAEIQRRSRQSDAEAWVPWTEVERGVHERLNLEDPGRG
jgi:hypothetical protein